MKTLLHFLPLTVLGVFFAVAIVGRALIQWRRYGTLGIALFREGSLRARAGEIALALVSAVFGAQAIGYAFGWLAFPRVPFAVRIGGCALSLLALVFLVRAQLQMGASWRIGIERDARPGLVTHGFYRVSRNPIYTFMLLALVGFAISLPTVVSWFSVAFAVVSVRIQVRDEEAYLLDTYDGEFLEYAQRVGRFVPGIGLLRRA
jgi:protein-S-isoprenylcysteine O-methyltransferase Ste14